MKVLARNKITIIAAMLIFLGIYTTAAADGYTYSDDDYTDQYDITSASVSITEGGTYIVYGNSTSTSNTITVNASEDVVLVLENVVISSSKCPLSLANSATTTLVLSGDNNLKNTVTSSGYPGILKDTTGNLIIAAYGNDNSAGSLTATGGDRCAGIGGMKEISCSNVIINSGTITAKGGSRGAGVGGGYYGSGSDITVNGGIIEAKGGSYSAGIGGGGGSKNYDNSGVGKNITINSGTVTATGGENGAGIGGGGSDKNNGTNAHGIGITINGGIVTATGGSCGAGIGGGVRGSGSNITITNGTVTASGGDYSAGIGGGSGDSSATGSGDGSNIIVSGGMVTATGGVEGAGIGSGDRGDCDGITISGGTVTATGGTSGDGIGDYSGTTDNIIIYNSSVKASSIGDTPTDVYGEDVYLYTIPDTTAGDSIIVDGDTIIKSIVHHTEDDTNQYLYLPSNADYAFTNDTLYALSYDKSGTVVESGLSAEINSSAFTGTEDDIYVVNRADGSYSKYDGSLSEYIDKPVLTVMIANAVSGVEIDSYTVMISGGSLEGEQSFTPAMADLFDGSKYYMAQIIGDGIESGGDYNVIVEVVYTIGGITRTFVKTGEL